MIGTLLAALLFIAAGYPVARIVASRREVFFLLAVAFLAGSGVASAALLLLDNVAIRWSLLSFLAATALLTVVIALSTRKLRAELTVTSEGSIGERLVWALLAVVAVAHARFATITELVEWDYVAMWGLKARNFLAAGGIDWQFLERPENLNHNTDYPPLMNFVFDAAALLGGGWEHRWTGLFFTFYGVATFIVAWFLVRRAGIRSHHLPFAAFLLFVSFSERIGLAGGPYIAFAFAGLALLREGMLLDRLKVSGTGGVLLGLAAMTKNEGLALIVAVAIALAISMRWRHFVALLPAVAIAAWWQILRAIHGLETARAAGDRLTRIEANLAKIGEWGPALWSDLEKPLFWFVVMLLIVMAGWRILWRERFLATALLVQLGFIFAAYLVSHVDIRLDLQYSWERVSHQLAISSAFLALVALAGLTTIEAQKNERA